MADGTIQHVNRAGGVRGGDDLPPSALQDGALTLFDDGEAVFTGNGSTTAANVMNRVIELKAAEEPALAVFAGAAEAHLFTAQHNLVKHNPHLANKDPESAIPAGEQFFARTNDLQELLAPFVNNLGALRELVAESRTGLGGVSVATGAGIYSQGLGLPVDGEPPPQPSDKVTADGLKPS